MRRSRLHVLLVGTGELADQTAAAAQAQGHRVTVAGDVLPRADVALVCVEEADPLAVAKACVRLAPAARLVAVRTPVPPGTVRDLITPMVVRAAPGVAVASMPAMPGRRGLLLGVTERGAAAVLSRLDGRPATITSPTDAELAAAALPALQVTLSSLAQELANVCAVLDGDIDEVLRLVGPAAWPRPGLGTAAEGAESLAHAAREMGAPAHVLEAALTSNARQPLEAVTLLEQELGTVDGRRIAVIGAAVGPLCDTLRSRGAFVLQHEAPGPASLEGADGCVVAASRPAWRELDWEELASSMREPVIVDGWRVIDPARLPAHVRYHAIGRAVPAPPRVLAG